MSMVSHYPRVDANADLYVNVIGDDVKCAVPRDHCNCAVAQAIKRAVGTPEARAVIFPSVAYVLMPCDTRTARHNKGSGAKPGKLAWHRFRIGPVLGKQILSFDELGDAAPDGYRFRAPTPSQRLVAKRGRARIAQRPGSRGRIAPRAPWRRSRTFMLADEEP